MIDQATINELRRLMNAIDQAVERLIELEAAYNALLIAAEACRKGREEAERKVDELRKRLP